MYKELKKYLDSSRKITLISNIDGDEEEYHGYVVALSKELVCLWLIEDWHHDGFLVTQNCFVTEILHGNYEKTYDRILKAEGCLIELGKPDWLNVNCYENMFVCLNANCNVVSIESRLSDVDEFVLGRIIAVNDISVSLKGFDATGTWQEGCYQIPFDEITAVKFGDEYSSVFIKYVDQWSHSKVETMKD